MLRGYNGKFRVGPYLTEPTKELPWQELEKQDISINTD